MSPNRAGHLTLLPAAMDNADRRDVLADLMYLISHQKHPIAVLFGKCETFQESNKRCQSYFDFVKENQFVFEPYFRASESHHQTARLREAVNYLQMITYLTVMTRDLDNVRKRNYGFLFSGFEEIVGEVVNKINGRKLRKDQELPLELVAFIRSSALAAGK